MNQPKTNRKAFSLVEVVLALGLLTFALVAIVGLLDVGLKASKSAQVDTVEAAAARSVLSIVRTNSLPSFAGATNWFNFDGIPEANLANAYFQCVVTTNVPPPGISPTNMIGVRMEFQYPIAAPTANRVTNVFNASIVRQP